MTETSYVEEQEGGELVLTFDEVGAIAGVPLDHSFLNYKKELLQGNQQYHYHGFHNTDA